MGIISNCWDKQHLEITDINGRKELAVTQFTEDLVHIFRDKGYKRILDVGCGYGKNGFFFQSKGFEVSFSDIDGAKIAWLKSHVNEHCRMHQFSFESIPLPDCSFDAVICFSVLHHARLEQIVEGLDELYRIINAGGCLAADMISTDDESFGVGVKVEENTFIGSRSGEEDIPHHYTTKSEIEKLYSKYSKVITSKHEYILSGTSNFDFSTKLYDIIAFK